MVPKPTWRARDREKTGRTAIDPKRSLEKGMAFPYVHVWPVG
jgi:hypothetical protein